MHKTTQQNKWNSTVNTCRFGSNRIGYWQLVSCRHLIAASWLPNDTTTIWAPALSNSAFVNTQMHTPLPALLTVNNQIYKFNTGTHLLLTWYISMLTMCCKRLTHCQQQFDDVRTSNVFTRFEIRRTFWALCCQIRFCGKKSLFYN